jgi:excinuclease ABC subunit A
VTEVPAKRARGTFVAPEKKTGMPTAKPKEAAAKKAAKAVAKKAPAKSAKKSPGRPRKA